LSPVFCPLFSVSYLCCYNKPMSRYSDFPPRQRNRASAILTISVVVSLMLLLGIGSLFWLVQNRFLLAPTPTPTATPAPLLTATPDFRATGVMEDMLT